MFKRLMMSVLVLSFTCPVVFANGITGWVSASEVRDITVEALQAWALDPVSLTACGGGDCCASPTVDNQCTKFAVKVRQNATFWAQLVEREYKMDGDWACETVLVSPTSNSSQTYCTTVSGTPLVDVSRIASELANLEETP